MCCKLFAIWNWTLCIHTGGSWQRNWTVTTYRCVCLTSSKNVCVLFLWLLMRNFCVSTCGFQRRNASFLRILSLFKLSYNTWVFEMLIDISHHLPTFEIAVLYVKRFVVWLNPYEYDYLLARALHCRAHRSTVLFLVDEALTVFSYPMQTKPTKQSVTVDMSANWSYDTLC